MIKKEIRKLFLHGRKDKVKAFLAQKIFACLKYQLEMREKMKICRIPLGYLSISIYRINLK